MENIQDIPGYYYDAGKKKFFKIQASSQAPASSAYSSKDVKRRKIEDERIAAKVREVARYKDCIRRSDVLKAPLAGGFLHKELGYSANDTEMGEVYVRGLISQGGLSSDLINYGEFFNALIQRDADRTRLPSNGGGGIFAVTPRTDLAQEGIVDIRIAWEDQLFTIHANTDKYNRSDANGSLEICHGVSGHGLRRVYQDWEQFGHSGPATSISINETNRRVATTWLSGSSHSGISVVRMAQTLTAEESISNDANIVLGPGHSQSEIDVLSSAAAPSQSSLLFAFGTSHGIIAMEKEDLRTSYLGRRDILHQTFPKDVFALEFLADNHNVLLSGGRNGILNITDLRIPSFGPDPDIITHPSSITHIKQIDAHRIIVTGLNSHLCQYDLRFRKKDRLPWLPNPRIPISGVGNSFPTRSIVQYPEYYNSGHIQTGFDVDTETGVVVTCQERIAGTHHDGVQLFSLHGGHKLKSPLLSRYSALEEGDGDAGPEWTDCDIRCVRFVRDSESKMKSLYIMDSDLRRYTWAPEDDSDSEEDGSSSE